MSDKHFIRVQKNRNYSAVSTDFISDERLSWKARGIMAYLLSKPDDWQFEPENLKGISKDGIKSVHAGLKELIEYGYLQKLTLNDG